LPWSRTPAPRAQGVAVYTNITGGGAKKLNIAVPEFTVLGGTDTAGLGKLLASVAGQDLTFSGLFSVVAGTGSIPSNNPQALRQAWAEFAAAGAPAAPHGPPPPRGGPLARHDVLHAGLPGPLPPLPVRAPPRADPRGVRRDQLVAVVEPGRALPRGDALERRQPRDLRPRGRHGDAAPPHPARRHRHRAGLVADGSANRVRVRPQRTAAPLRDGSGRVQRPPDHLDRLSHPAALVAEGRHDRLHAARGHARPLGGEPGRLEPASSHRRSRRQRGRGLGSEWASPRVSVESPRPVAGLRDAARRLTADTDLAGARRAHKPLVVAAAAVIGLLVGKRDSRPKGGVMGRRGAHLTIMLLLVLGVVAAGCAKRPATTSVAAPPPSAPAPAAPPATPAPAP